MHGLMTSEYNWVAFTYSTQQAPPLHIHNPSPPSNLNGTHYAYWKIVVKSHLCSANLQLWDIVKKAILWLMERTALPPKKGIVNSMLPC
jgi:hypothetical protein